MPLPLASSSFRAGACPPSCPSPLQNAVPALPMLGVHSCPINRPCGSGAPHPPTPHRTPPFPPGSGSPTNTCTAASARRGPPFLRNCSTWPAAACCCGRRPPTLERTWAQVPPALWARPPPFFGERHPGTAAAAPAGEPGFDSQQQVSRGQLRWGLDWSGHEPLPRRAGAAAGWLAVTPVSVN